MNQLKRHTNIALYYFIIAASFGVLLRSMPWVELLINYRFIVHTHSHIALLGWVYIALTTLLYTLFIRSTANEKLYRRIFWFTQITLLGMLLSFPLQGYALFSIVFSTLFLFASYWFTWFFLKRAPKILKKTYAYKCIRVALWYLVFSSIGPWALGAIMTTLGSASVWYRLAIYFYLHFTYNGWMIMALVGLFFFIIEQSKFYIPVEQFKRFFWSLNSGILLSFFLSTLFAEPSIVFYILGGIGALLQLFALYVLLKELSGCRKNLSSLFTTFQFGVLKTIVVLWGFKMLLQLLTALPYFANLSTKILDFTIGYLHWTFLGVVTIALFLFLDYFKLLHFTKKGYKIYLLGFALTEILIFYRGMVAWLEFPYFQGYTKTLAIVSCIIPVSLLFIVVNNYKKNKQAL